ncbi:MAG: hypothetical protein ACFFDH_00100 [Promethearchaeota archaeon]
MGPAAESLQNLLKAGVGLDDAEDLLRRFTNEAITGKSSSIDLATAVGNLSFAYATNNSALGNLSGISENFNDIIKKGEEALIADGVAAGDITEEMAKFRGMMDLTNLTLGSSERFMGTLEDKSATLQLQMQDLRVEVGSKLEPMLSKLLDLFVKTGALEAFGKIVKKVFGTIAKVGKIFINTFSKRFGEIKEALGGLGEAFGRLGKLFKVDSKDMKKGVKGFANTAVDSLIKIINKVTKFINLLVDNKDKIINIINKVKKVFEKLKPISKVLITISNPVLLLITLWKKFGKIFKKLWDDDLSPAFESLKSAFQTISSVVQTVVPVLITVLKPVIAIIGVALLGVIKIVTIHFKIWAKAVEIAANIISGVIEFLKVAFIGLKFLVKKVIEGIKQFIEDWKLIFQAAVRFIKGRIELWKEAFRRLKELIKKVVEAVKADIERIKATFAEVKARIVEIKNKIVTAFKNMKERITNIWNGVVNVIKSAINGIIGIINKGINRINNLIDAIRKVPVVGEKIPDINIPTIALLKKGGEFTVPPGFNNDDFLMGVSSGEHVKVTPANQVTNDNRDQSKKLSVGKVVIMNNMEFDAVMNKFNFSLR